VNPVINNILITFLSLVYVFGVVGLMDFAVKKGLSQEISRKIVHIAAGSWLLFWPLFTLTDWTKYLNIAPALIWSIMLLIKGFTALPDDKAVKTMTRTGDRKELLKGPFYFTLVMNVMGTVFLFYTGAIISMGFLSWGDGLAPVFGKKFGKHKYRILSDKTLEGSIAFFISGIAGSILFSLILLGNVNFTLIIITAIITTLVEAASPPNWDNILIPVSAMLVSYFYL
jgi:phytol kinase